VNKCTNSNEEDLAMIDMELAAKISHNSKKDG
jgi:hypothetical protein